MAFARLPKIHTGVHRGVSYVLKRTSVDRWHYSLSLGEPAKTGSVKARLGLLAVRRVQMLIDRLQKAVEE